MLSHAEFRTLRLRALAPHLEVVDLKDWEFMDRMWIGEAVGFSEWLRPTTDPHSLGSLALGTELPPELWDAVLARLGLLVRRGMTRAAIEAVLGPPLREERFVDDRVSLEYVLGVAEKFDVSSTIHNEEGLLYLVVMTRKGRRAALGKGRGSS